MKIRNIIIVLMIFLSFRSYVLAEQKQYIQVMHENKYQKQSDTVKTKSVPAKSQQGLNNEECNRYINEALKQIDQNNLFGAQTSLTRALDINPNNVKALKIRGQVKNRLGDNVGALQDLNKAISLKPDGDCYYARGVVKLSTQNYPEAVVITGKKREQSLALARDKYGATVAILDDGYQYKKLARDVNILLLDHKRPISTGFPFPFGYLREFPFAINRSDIIIFTRAKNDNIPDNVKGFINKQSIYFSDTVFHRVAIKNEFVELSYIKGTKVCAYSAIANNEVFYNTLIEAGLDVVFFAGFRDHSLLEEKTINGILTQGKNKGASLFITTEKDFVKLPSAYQPLFSYIKIDIELNNKEGLLKDIEKLTSM